MELPTLQGPRSQRIQEGPFPRGLRGSAALPTTFGLLASRTVRQGRSVLSRELVGITLLGIDTGLYTMQGVGAGHLASGSLDTQINVEQNLSLLTP